VGHATVLKGTQASSRGSRIAQPTAIGKRVTRCSRDGGLIPENASEARELGSRIGMSGRGFSLDEFVYLDVI
jgi:hypothetical protein